MAITPLPDPPSRADPSSFSDRADDFLGALPLFVAQTNATAAEMEAAAVTAINAPGTSGTSITSLAVGTGSKTFTLEQTGKAFARGQFVIIARTAAPTTYMHGQITAYDSSTGAMTVSVSNTGGGGTYAAWTVSLSLPQIALPLSGNAEVSGPVRFSVTTRFGESILLDGGSPSIQFGSTGATFWNPVPNSLAIGPADRATHRMFFDVAGQVNVHGQRGSSGNIQASGALRVIAGYVGGYAVSTYDVNNYTAVQFVRDVGGNPVQTGSITVTDTGVSYNTNSDYRLKENPTPITGALDRVLSVPALRFNFIGSDVTVDGFLAHEAARGVPEAVQGEKDAMVDIGRAVPPPQPAPIVGIRQDKAPAGWGWSATGEQDGEPVGTATAPAAPAPLAGIPQTQCPPGWTWTKTGEVEAYQSIDQAKLVPVLWAAVQELAGEIAALKAQLGAPA
ncbi:tail fiber domain-containing protein [Sphingomonas sp. ABOLE]|uniref:tail fiber domain-containing protein n=1 Tax=Sphingomonas sp. ABOLE TaxID=1985878 RepID=UPI000F7F4A87|nr:tail fiber domain-containing protein [Sphingomonas sp. ABOLE]RSV41541.1 tail fiber domain-containing protein [Sphingomonas sp. ABOLE]